MKICCPEERLNVTEQIVACENIFQIEIGAYKCGSLLKVLHIFYLFALGVVFAVDVL